jgi:hypothetical protein
VVRYTSRPEDRRRNGRARLIALIALSLLIGLLVGRASIGRDRDPGSASPPPAGRPGTVVQHSHDEKGAAAAAANLSAALAYSIARGPEDVQRVVAQIGTARYAERVKAAYPAGSASDQSSSVFFRAIPISYRVVAYAPEQASVRIWSASILATADASPGAASFKTATVVVRWSGGAWKVDDVRQPVEGPTPATTAASRGSDFARQLAGTEVLHVQP